MVIDPTAGYLWYLDFMYTDITIDDHTTGHWTAANDNSGTDNINVLNSGWLKLLSDANVDGVAGSDQGRFVALADYHGGAFFLHDPKGPYVSAWLASTPGFVDNLGDPPLNLPY